MDMIVLVLVTGGVFLIADAIMLPKVIKPLFERQLGRTMLAKPRPLPATLFYLLYVAGIIWFAGWPALVAGAPALAFLNGAVLGLVAYGTYELVSWTVMRDWHARMVAVDMAWGTVLSAVSAGAGVVAALAFT
ncbi:MULTISPECIES: DUF2177 family protein [unclassified Yoonia]|uniref:DUF2177 family protein n=1 Tax=unclassified Yoonia TaxID=2629118 RepID=UPI002AFFB6CE|nr:MULTISPECIES: DUF2177 family protein [unclassified Yoonia]